MNCFCYNQFYSNYTNFLKIDFEDMGEQVLTYDCIEWAKQEV